MPAANPPAAKPVVHPGTYPEPKRRRRNEGTMIVWSPTGAREVHSTSNARDLVRGCGYTLAPPEQVRAAKEAAEAVKKSVADAATAPDTEAEKNPSPALEEIFAMRGKITELTGTVPPMNWGRKRLTAELEKAKAKAAASAPKEGVSSTPPEPPEPPEPEPTEPTASNE